MEERSLHKGAVYQRDWDKKLIRIIAFDDKDAVFDTWCPGTSSWDIDSLSRTISYLRLPIPVLLKNAIYIRTEEYAEAEMKIHRPDLPLSFVQATAFEWASTCPNDIEQLLGASTQSEGVATLLAQSIDLPAVYLSPFSPKGGMKPLVLVEALNGRSFTAGELLLCSARLQSEHVRDSKVTKGVGIYRLGINRMIPTYYLWGAKGRAQL